MEPYTNQQVETSVTIRSKPRQASAQSKTLLADGEARLEEAIILARRDGG
jgi:hypothetical protein